MPQKIMFTGKLPKPKRLKKYETQIWKTIPICILWTTWLGKNGACFGRNNVIYLEWKNQCLDNVFLHNSGVLEIMDQYLDFLYLFGVNM